MFYSSTVWDEDCCGTREGVEVGHGERFAVAQSHPRVSKNKKGYCPRWVDRISSRRHQTTDGIGGTDGKFNFNFQLSNSRSSS